MNINKTIPQNKELTTFSNSILSLENLTASRKIIPVINNFDYSFKTGKIYLLIGPNGIGKTTLLRTIAGFLKPFSGFVKYDGVPIHNNFRRYVKNINYLGHLNGLSPTLSVKNNLSSWAGITDNNRNFEKILNTLDLEKLTHQPVVELSSGQQRRVALSRLLLNKRKIWLLDEPLNSIDTKNQNIFFNIINDHLDNNGIVIMATHQIPKIIPAKFIDKLDLSSKLC